MWNTSTVHTVNRFSNPLHFTGSPNSEKIFTGLNTENIKFPKIRFKNIKVFFAVRFLF